MYVFEEEKLKQEIVVKKPKRVLLQLPEGLKREGLRLASWIQRECNVEVILSGEPVWGACDLAISEAKSLGCDCIVLYGHASFMDVDFPVIYLEARFEKDIHHLLEQVAKELQGRRSIALLTSVQHMQQIPKIQEFFSAKNIEVVVPPGKGHAFYDGQVLGCEYAGLKIIAKEVDAVLIIANKFHALGAALSVSQEVILLDPCNEEIINMRPLKEKIVKQRAVAIGKTKEAEKIGVIIGVKPGQTFGSFDYVKEKLEKLGKKYVLISMAEVTDDKLVNLYDIEAFIELACPRIAIDAASLFSKPLLTAREFAVVCGDLEWEDLLKQGFL